MKIDNIKQLEAVLKLCRRQGVTDIKIDGIELHLAPIPRDSKNRSVSYQNSNFPDIPVITPGNVTESTPVEAAVQIATDELTEEELLFYSARPETGIEEAKQ